MPPLVPAAALVVFWSSGFVGARLGTGYAPADTLLAWRYLLAAAVLAAVAWGAGVRPTRAAWGRQTSLGLLCQVGYLGGTVTGIGLGVPAGTAALIAAVQPLVVATLAGPVLGEVIDPRQWWALGAGFLGVGLIVGGDLGAGSAPAWAYALPLGGTLALAVGTLLGRRWQDGRRQGGEGVLEALTLQTAVAAVVFTAVAATRSSLAPPTGSGFWWSVAWVVCLSSFGGYGAYLLVLRRSGATRVSALLYLTPPTTMVWAYLMFGDAVSALGVVGLAFCAVSVSAVLRPTPGPASMPPTDDPPVDARTGAGRGPACPRSERSRRGGSNPQPPVYKTGALPVAPRRRPCQAPGPGTRSSLAVRVPTPAASRSSEPQGQPGPSSTPSRLQADLTSQNVEVTVAVQQGDAMPQSDRGHHAVAEGARRLTRPTAFPVQRRRCLGVSRGDLRKVSGLLQQTAEVAGTPLVGRAREHLQKDHVRRRGGVSLQQLAHRLIG